MINKKYFNVSAQQVSIGPNAILKIEGNYLDAESVFIQIHDANTTPANGAVPLKSWPVSGGTDADPIPFFQSFVAGELKLSNGLYVCLSSTDGTKTLASSDKMDLFVELEAEDPYLGATVSGDLTTGRSALAIAAGRRLRRIEYLSSDIDVGTLYLQLHLTGSPAEGRKADASFTLPQNTVTAIVKTLGYDGRLTDTTGGQLKMSSTPDVLTTSATNVCIKAIHTAA